MQVAPRALISVTVHKYLHQYSVIRWYCLATNLMRSQGSAAIFGRQKNMFKIK